MQHPDYNHLYMELGLQPGCEVEQLRHAYRRHVAGLHPDRGEPARHREDGALPLSDLNALYGEAIRFHQRYGRLPGARQPVHVRVPPSAPSAAGPAGTAADGVGSRAGSGRRTWLALLLVAAVLAGLVLGSPDTHAPVIVHRQVDAVPDAAASSGPPLPSRLALGMDAETVLAIQGEPMRRSDVEWTYGPSWLRFEDGKLADWYSSHLHPLHTASSRPPVDASTEQAF